MLLLSGCTGGVVHGKAEHGGVAVMSVVGAQPRPPPISAADEPGSVAVASTAHGILYNGGPIMPGTVNIYYIWYGNWTGNSAESILTDWGNNIGSTPNYFVNVSYDDSSGKHVESSVHLAGQTFDRYSQGANFAGNKIFNIVTAALDAQHFPVDSNGVYFVLTSADVNITDGFCTQFCGWHTFGTYNGTNIKFSFVGNPQRCNGSCGNLGTTPNGNAAADNMASIMFHELSETVSDPLINAWGDSKGENGDKCAWNFGPTYGASNGSPANARVGNRDFLLQQMWANVGGGFCAQAISPPSNAKPPTGCGQMVGGLALTAGESLKSCDARFNLSMQYDGNLVLYQGAHPLWASDTYLSQAYAGIMQTDGNLVVYDVNQRPLWASNTWGQPGNSLFVQNDGNLVVYNSASRPVWNSNTCCH
jgi:hypothetical protein